MEIPAILPESTAKSQDGTGRSEEKNKGTTPNAEIEEGDEVASDIAKAAGNASRPEEYNLSGSIAYAGPYILLAIISQMWKEEDIRSFIGMNKETWKLHRRIGLQESLQVYRAYHRVVDHLNYSDRMVHHVLSELISDLLHSLLSIISFTITF